MAKNIIGGSQLMEVLRDGIREALSKFNSDTSEMAEFYVVNLLRDFHLAEGRLSCGDNEFDEKPLAISFMEAMEETGSERPHMLRAIGDRALISSGLFADRIHVGIMRQSYYTSIGKSAYEHLAYIHGEDNLFNELYLELSEKFVDLAEAIACIAPWNSAKSDVGIFKIYKRWLSTGDERLKTFLINNGIAIDDDKERTSK